MEELEQLKEEVQKLREKNAQLLNEKKAVQTQRDELKEQLDAAGAERDTAQSDLKRITVDLPRADVLESTAVEGMADMLKRELEHHFEIVRIENGKDMFHKDGAPLEIEGKPVEFTPAGIQKLNEKGIIKIGSLIRGRGASGGGAAGGSKEAFTGQPQNSNPAPRQQFGLK